MPPAEGNAAGRYRVAEWSFRSTVEYANPWREIEVAFVFTTPAGRELRVPAFWAGGRRWRARYSSGELGEHRFRTECSDSGNACLHGRTGSVRVVEAASENPLFRHGPVRLGPSRTHLEHADGTPFFWLADTWWMGLAERLRWPEDVRRLTRDRVAKGFTVVQIVAGLYPDMEPFDERAQRGGLPLGQGLQPHQSRVFRGRRPADHQGPDDRLGVYAAGIEGQLAVLFVPMHALWKLANGIVTLGALDPGEAYEVVYFDPISGAERLVPEPLVAGADGRATLPPPAEVRDWVLLVRRKVRRAVEETGRASTTGRGATIPAEYPHDAEPYGSWASLREPGRVVASVSSSWYLRTRTATSARRTLPP